MAFFQERAEWGADAIMQHDFGADQIRALIIDSARCGSVAIDALGGIEMATAIGGCGIDDLFVVRSDGIACGALGAGSPRPGCWANAAGTRMSAISAMGSGSRVIGIATR